MALDFKQVDADLVPFRRRLLFVFFLVIVLFCVLIGRFAWLQIINENAYTERTLADLAARIRKDFGLLQYGKLVLIICKGRLLQLERTEKQRFTGLDGEGI